MTDDLERRLREACDRTGKPSGAHMIDVQRMIAKVMAERLDDEDAQCIAQVADCMAHCIENEALLFECLRTEALQAADEIARLRAENEALQAENFKLAAGACNVEGGLIGDDHGHFDCSLKARIEALERELAEVRDYARKVSIAFTDVTGGGSEMFTRIGDEFYADPEACRARVRERYESAQKLGAVRAVAIRNGERG